MADNLEQSIRDNAAGPAKASGDSGSIEQHKLPDQIAADRLAVLGAVRSRAIGPVRAGLAAARARGRNGGRPKVTADETKVVLAKNLHPDKSLEIDDICSTLRISRSTFYRYVRLE